MPFVEPQDIGPKPWGHETLLAHVPGKYTLKRLVYEADHQGGFQYHREKDEAFTLHEGAALVEWEENGKIHFKVMREGQTFHVPPGTPHKFMAFTRCVVYEASTPHFNDRVNVADKYGDVDGQAR